MHYVIHAGGIPFDGSTINERSLGGSESAAYYTAKELAARKHRVVVFTEKEQQGMESDGVKYLWMGARTAKHPLGENWHFYCENTPHDVNIVQRYPSAFFFYVQSKINLWWAHDIALKRNNQAFMAGLWQTTRVMPVSHWFKSQIQEAWLCNPEIITPIHNGVDYSLYDHLELKDNAHTQEGDELVLLYQSRPERGLEHLVREGGIMERLIEEAPHARLLVAGYDHAVPHLQGYYDYLRGRVEDLPNCEHLGELTKADLVLTQCQRADVLFYPTEFEEVSCITAMEAMAAGMYVATTNCAALPETLGDYDNQVRFNLGDDLEDKFVAWAAKFDNKFRRRPDRSYPWSRTADEIEEIVQDCFERGQNDENLSRHFLHTSDVVALEELDCRRPVRDSLEEYQSDVVMNEYEKLYEPWMRDPEKFADHYEQGSEYGDDFVYEGESFVRHPRFVEVARFVDERTKPNDTIVDYGCAHGHFTNYLAKTFPDRHFVGVDVAQVVLDLAVAKAEELELTNVEFLKSDGDPRSMSVRCDALIAGEVLEHVADPVQLVTSLRDAYGYVPIVITTPFGPWESESYERGYPRRYHLHHYERQDLEDLFGHHDDVEFRCLPARHNAIGELLGWYITSFTMFSAPARSIDYERKLREQAPRQTVSLCVIARDAEADILRALRSAEPYVDEVVVGIDENTRDGTIEAIDSFAFEVNEKRHRSPRLRVHQFDIPSPTEVGFDEARNLTVERATMDWIMWMDCDEVLVGGERLPKYLRQNGWDGYGIQQHHFSTEPLGVLSTDFPVRLFRRKDNIRFQGVVHEHPVDVNKPNDGVGFAYVLNEVHFSHYGYTTEAVRRQRFMRNVGLMARDREKYPDRLLGKFLWIRDLALMCRFDAEQLGVTTPEMITRAKMGVDLWEEVVRDHGAHPQVRRMVRDHLEFYDTLVRVLDRGFVFKMKMASGTDPNAVQLNGNKELAARFYSREHLDLFLELVINSEVEDYEAKYH